MGHSFPSTLTHRNEGASSLGAEERLVSIAARPKGSPPAPPVPGGGGVCFGG